MHTHKRRYWDPTAMNDLLFNLLVGITMLFFLVFLLINPPDDGKDIESKAEYLIMLDWPDNHPADVDLWVMAPTGKAIGFPAREETIANLERDDRGSLTDWFKTTTVESVYDPVNREVITIRSIHNGEWIINVHYYASRFLPTSHVAIDKVDSTWVVGPDPSRVPVNVEVQLIKLNPVYSIVARKKITLTHTGHEETMIRFILDREGNIEKFIDAPSMFVTRPERH